MLRIRRETWRPPGLRFFKWGTYLESKEDLNEFERGVFVRFGRVVIQWRTERTEKEHAKETND